MFSNSPTLLKEQRTEAETGGDGSGQGLVPVLLVLSDSRSTAFDAHLNTAGFSSVGRANSYDRGLEEAEMRGDARGEVEVGALQSTVCRRHATHIEGPSVYYLGIIDILQVLLPPVF